MAKKRADKQTTASLPPIGPEPLPMFVWTTGFAGRWAALGLTHADEIRLEGAILEAPGDPSTRTDVPRLHKIRFASSRSGAGKSGGHRACYAAFLDHGVILMVTIFGKGEKSNLSPADKAQALAVIREVERFLKERGR